MATISWTAPTAEEQELWNAQQRDDKNAYLAALARTDVFVARPIDPKAKAGYRKDADYMTVRRGLRPVLCVFTRGVLPGRPPEGAYWTTQMFPQWVRKLAAGPRASAHLLINAGTPLERDLTVAEAAAWMKQNPQRVLYMSDLNGTVRTVANEPVEGELARGLACNAHLAVTNARPWNTMDRPFVDYKDTLRSNRELWHITGPVVWQNKVDKLLDREKFPWPADDVFGIRLANGAGVKPSGDPAADGAVLSEAVDAWCEDRRLDDGARRDRLDIARWIPRIEAWMRRDGLLPEDGIVETQAVFHWARCVNMALDGYVCDFCERGAAEQIVEHAGRLCARTYADWAELSAAYIIGRVIQMGRGGTAEQLYTQSLTRHRVLMQDPASPWLRLSLR